MLYHVSNPNPVVLSLRLEFCVFQNLNNDVVQEDLSMSGFAINIINDNVLHDRAHSGHRCLRRRCNHKYVSGNGIKAIIDSGTSQMGVSGRGANCGKLMNTLS